MKNASLLKKTLFVMIVAIPILLMAASAFAAGPTGAGPNDPMLVPTGPVSIPANSMLWFYFDYSNDRLGPSFGGRPATGGPGGPGGFGGGPGRGGSTGRIPVDVTVDAAGIGGLDLSIWTTAQANAWIADRTTAPVAHGTAYHDTSTGATTHDLYWAGGFIDSGRYYAAVTNSNSFAVVFNMTVTGDSVTLYPQPLPSPTPTLFVPLTVTPIQIGTIQGKIVFETATGGDIYTVNGDGSNLAKVSHGIDPSFSPDGKKIVFSRWDNTNPGVFIANADGSNEAVLFGAPRTRWPRFSPDGKYVVFSQDKTRVDNNPIWKLGLIELATGKLSEPQCSNQCFVPSWTKDSQNIIYTDPSIGILITNILTGPATLVGPTGTYWDTNANIPRPIVNWPPMQTSIVSPDGAHIAFSMQTHDRWELNSMNIDGSNQIGITQPDPVQYYLLDVAVHNVDPVWSPDSQQILFLSDRNGKWEFFVTDPAGKTVKQVLKSVTDKIAVNYAYNNERMMDWTK